MASQDLDYEAWLVQANIETRTVPGPPDARPDVPGSLGSIPAEYIQRALKEDKPTRKIVRGLRSPGLTIHGDLHLENVTAPFPMFFDGCVFEGDLHIWRMKVGTLSFVGTTIKGGVELRGTEVSGHLLMRDGFTAEGPIVARDMTITGSAEFTDATFAYDGKSKNAFDKTADGECFGFSRSKAAALYWRNFQTKPNAKVNLRDVHVGSFMHDLNADPPLRSWPQPGKLILDGFTYGRIEECRLDRALAWLQLQDGVVASSYAMLAQAFEAINKRAESEGVLAEFKRKEIGMIPNRLKRWLFFLIYWIIDYGRTPQRALFLVLALFIGHVALVWYAQSVNAMRPAVNEMLRDDCFSGPGKDCKKDLKDWQFVPVAPNLVRRTPRDYPPLEPLEYSLEAFVPILDLQQKAYWEPTSAGEKIVLSLMSALGIFLGGLFVGAIAGLLTPRPKSAR